MESFGRLMIAVSKVRTAASRLSDEDRARVQRLLDSAGGTTITLDLTEMPAPLIERLIEEPGNSPGQRRLLQLFARPREEVFDQPVGHPRELHSALTLLAGHEGRPNAETQINGRWYPVHLSSYHSEGSLQSYCSVRGSVEICDVEESVGGFVSESDFFDDDGRAITLSVRQILERLGFRGLGTNMRQYILTLRDAERLGRQAGKVMDVTNAVVVKHEFTWWEDVDSIPLGSPVSPRRVVIEPDLESKKRDSGGYRGGRSAGSAESLSLPFVRCFSLDLKKYVYADVRDLEEHRFDGGAIDRLVLPAEMDRMLRTVFATDTSFLFGDLVFGKHGGMVMLANGPTGVGKTLTAEVFAEHTRRPLYVLEMGELGTSLESVEQNLQRVFMRAARWNAVLLMDEADVFMARRDADLERSAIVGVFLRLLDYYPGLLFLTSNRAEALDPAFKSRITLRLDYPELAAAARRRIWETMLRLAGLELTEGAESIPDVPLNGRQIRNMVRLLKVMHPDGRLTSEQILELCRFSCD